MLGIWGEEAVTGKSTTSDIRRKKQSLPIVYALSRNTPAARDLAALKPGDLVAVLPIHSCLTADLLKEYLTLDGRRISMMHYV